MPSIHSCRLVVFDLDGTLVDSQASIVACAQAAFAAAGLAVPPAEAIRRIVGLSLIPAMALLVGRDEPMLATRLAELYREAFLDHRASPDFNEPLFAGVAQTLDALSARDLLMGVATGKAMRGLVQVLERHGLKRHFVTLQTADLHPSKPHPAMLRAALADTGTAAGAAAMVGDTTYDILMAKAAGVTAVGVAYGNHPSAELTAAGAAHIVNELGDLLTLLPPPSLTK